MEVLKLKFPETYSGLSKEEKNEEERRKYTKNLLKAKFNRTKNEYDKNISNINYCLTKLDMSFKILITDIENENDFLNLDENIFNNINNYNEDNKDINENNNKEEY